jgi:hypothetical protein
MVQVWSTDILSGPLFQALQPVLARVGWPAGQWPSHADYQALLDGVTPPARTAGGASLKVVAQAGSADHWQAGYEPRIYLTGELQTRSENWHDLFNLLVWAGFPRTKGALNRRHFELQQAREAQGAMKTPRNPAQDVLTQFDETGVIIACAKPELADLLRGFQWKDLFWQRREELAANMACYLFGHGLMEKALDPYRGMTGKGIVVPVAASFFSLPLPQRIARLDEALAERVGALQKPADLAPVPVLGFPGFTAENEVESYYDDRDYFRPGRRAGGGGE